MEEYIKRIKNTSFYKENITNIYLIEGFEDRGLFFETNKGYSSKEYRDFLNEITYENDAIKLSIEHLSSASIETNHSEYMPKLILVDRKVI